MLSTSPPQNNALTDTVIHAFRLTETLLGPLLNNESEPEDSSVSLREGVGRVGVVYGTAIDPRRLSINTVMCGGARGQRVLEELVHQPRHGR
jgi:hypothetical protein